MHQWLLRIYDLGLVTAVVFNSIDINISCCYSVVFEIENLTGRIQELDSRSK